jgi:hypothetical protein
MTDQLALQEVAAATHPPAIRRITDSGRIRVTDGNNGHGYLRRTFTDGCPVA